MVFVGCGGAGKAKGIGCCWLRVGGKEGGEV